MRIERQPDRDERSANRWRARTLTATTLRLVVLLVPVAVSVAASFAVTRLLPAPAGNPARIWWLTGVVFVCGLLAWPARRQLRRLLPMAALLEMSILFPGEAPTRWKVAREAGSVRHLELLASGLPDAEPTKAATTILALVASLARHDRVTRGHCDRVRVFTDMIAEEMGLPKTDRDKLRWAALIHDVGKLDVPARLLRKPAKPTVSEWKRLRLHPQVGAQLTVPLATWLGEYAAVVVQHHERFDGSGYPAGLKGEQISLGARIVGLADAFEVMTAARPYKRASSRVHALREVVKCSGTHFDPDVVRALLAVSTPRLRRALGPASWIGQLPVVGTAPGGGLPAVASSMSRGVGAVMLGGVASAVVAGGVQTGGLPPAHHRPSTAADLSGTTSTGTIGVQSSPVGMTSAGTVRTATSAPTITSTAPKPPATAVASSAPPTVPAPSPAGPSAGTVGTVTKTVTGTVDGVTNGVTTTVTGTVDGVTAPVTGTVDGVTNTVTNTVSGLTGTGEPSATASPSPEPSLSPSQSGSSGTDVLGGLLGG